MITKTVWPSIMSNERPYRWGKAKDRWRTEPPRSPSVLEAVDRGRDTAAAGHERLAARLVHRHDRSVAHQTAEVGHLANALARYGADGL